MSFTAFIKFYTLPLQKLTWVGFSVLQTLYKCALMTLWYSERSWKYEKKKKRESFLRLFLISIKITACTYLVLSHSLVTTYSSWVSSLGIEKKSWEGEIIIFVAKFIFNIAKMLWNLWMNLLWPTYKSLFCWLRYKISLSILTLNNPIKKSFYGSPVNEIFKSKGKNHHHHHRRRRMRKKQTVFS